MAMSREPALKVKAPTTFSISGSGPQPRGWGDSRASARAESRAMAIGGLLRGGNIGSQRHSSRQASTTPSTSSRSSFAIASGRRSGVPTASHYAFQTEGDDRAGFLVAASVAADLEGDAAASEDLLERDEALSADHPRVALQRLDQNAFGPERLKALEGLQSAEPAVAALIAVHRATANLLIPDLPEAERYLAEAKQFLPSSLRPLLLMRLMISVLQRPGDG